MSQRYDRLATAIPWLGVTTVLAFGTTVAGWICLLALAQEDGVSFSLFLLFSLAGVAGTVTHFRRYRHDRPVDELLTVGNGLIMLFGGGMGLLLYGLSDRMLSGQPDIAIASLVLGCLLAGAGVWHMINVGLVWSNEGIDVEARAFRQSLLIYSISRGMFIAGFFGLPPSFLGRHVWLLVVCGMLMFGGVLGGDVLLNNRTFRTVLQPTRRTPPPAR